MLHSLRQVRAQLSPVYQENLGATSTRQTDRPPADSIDLPTRTLPLSGAAQTLSTVTSQ